MKMLLKKYEQGPFVIKYRRDNGSETWMQADQYFVLHDLSHFAIETMLQYKSAFMGMLNNGMHIKDFEHREKRNKIKISEEAVNAENIANLFLMELQQGELEDFNQTLRESFNPMKEQLNPVQLSPEQIDAVRNKFKQLVAEWNSTPPGGEMELEYHL